MSAQQQESRKSRPADDAFDWRNRECREVEGEVTRAGESGLRGTDESSG